MLIYFNNQIICIAYLAQIEYLKTEFQSLRIQSHQAIINYGKVLGEKISVERQIDKVKQQYQESLKEFNNKLNSIKDSTNKEMTLRTRELTDFKKHLNNEMNIKDIILKRQQKYSEILKKELVFSK